VPDARRPGRGGSGSGDGRADDDRLAPYRARRDFSRSPEPRGEAPAHADGTFVVHRHAARREHYDLRLAIGGTYKSWAVAKGPSVDPADRRLAVHVEDHPLEYGDFEGVIPEGEYGGGTVMLWDRGRVAPESSKDGKPPDSLQAAYERGRLKLRLEGEKLAGVWALVRMTGKRGGDGRNWLLIKEKDEAARPGGADAFLREHDRSVATGRTVAEIARDRDRVWRPGEGEAAPAAAGNPAGDAEGSDPSAVPDPSAMKGARPADLPDFVPPQLAQARDAPPDRGGDWLHEIKFDGYRLQCRVERGQARIVTRRGRDWTDKFPVLARAAAAFPVENAIVDGEITVAEAGGVPSFAALQQALSGERPAATVYYAFDLLHLNGCDLRDAALIDRKTALAALLRAAGSPAPILYSEHFEAEGERVFRHACRFALEGVVSKKRGAPYRSGRQRTWIKTKCIERQEFVVAGFAKPSTGPRGIGSLALAYYDGEGRLTYAGRVGTGFTERMGADLRRALEERRAAESPLDRSPVEPPKDIVWVRPELVCEVEFRAWTDDGLLRQSAFKGLRDDKPAEEVALERPVAANGREAGAPRRAGRAEVAGIALTHPDRVLAPDQGLSKLGLAEYWQSVAEAALPEIAGRPLSLVRCPSGRDGECFFQKHAMQGMPDAVRRVAIREDEGEQDHMAVDDAAGLVGLVQMGTLEIHAWGARADDVERPDRLVFDVDPDPDLGWDRVAAAAAELRDRLARLGLESVCKTTGGKGLHVVAPIRRAHRWPAVKAFARALAEAMAADAPERYLATAGKADRRGRIYVDYLRNARGATAVVAYSPRARPGAPVAAPVEWEEVAALGSARRYAVGTMPRRLAALGRDPWADLPRWRQGLTKRAFRALGLYPDDPA
jgi:bifunctional non-homologous end joining protein LigD